MTETEDFNEKETKRKVLVRNEQRKLRASFGNTIGGGVVSVGTAGPVVAWFAGTISQLPVLGIMIWFCIGVVIHSLAMDVLEGMEI